MFGSFGKSLTESSMSFVSQAAMDAVILEALALEKQVLAVNGTRSVKKRDMMLNDYQPKMEVDPETYEVRADGELLLCEPAEEVSMAQRYFLF